MLHLAASDGSSTRHSFASRFPFTLGRSRTAGFLLEGSGVWDVHASISVREGRFHVQPEGQALLLINDHPSSGAVLKMGDRLSLGAFRVVVSLAPAEQRGLGALETTLWIGLAVLAAAQVLFIGWLR